MAKSSSFLQLLTLVFMWMLVNAPRGGAITCDDVRNDLLPCLSYVVGFSFLGVPSSCCNGVRNLINRALTGPDRKTGCFCVKSLAAQASDSQLKRAQGIPQSCGVAIPFGISPNVDCTRVW